MQYPFPKIDHIEDVTKHIDGSSEFLVMERDNFIVIDYAVAFQSTFTDIGEAGSDIRRECRGLVFDKDGKIIRRPYHKFFNLNEREETQAHLVDFSQDHIVFDKMDGSMVASFMLGNDIIWGTRKVADQFNELVSKFVQSSKSKYEDFAKFCAENNLTPIFEYISPDNRIIVNYDREDLVLTGLRHNVTGVYSSYELKKGFANQYDIPMVETYGKVDEIDAFVNRIQNDVEDREGVVVRFYDGHMLKLKSAQYVKLHKTKSIMNEKTVLGWIINDELDDVFPFMTEEDRKEIGKFKDKVLDGIIESSEKMIRNIGPIVEKYDNRKDLALSDELKTVTSFEKQMAFKMFEGYDKEMVRENIISFIAGNLGSGPKIENVRYLFGDVHFSDRVMFSD